MDLKHEFDEATLIDSCIKNTLLIRNDKMLDGENDKCEEHARHGNNEHGLEI